MKPEGYGAAIYIFWAPGLYRISVSPVSSLAVLRGPPLLSLDLRRTEGRRSCIRPGVLRLSHFSLSRQSDVVQSAARIGSAPYGFRSAKGEGQMRIRTVTYISSGLSTTRRIGDVNIIYHTYFVSVLGKCSTHIYRQTDTVPTDYSNARLAFHPRRRPDIRRRGQPGRLPRFAAARPPADYQRRTQTRPQPEAVLTGTSGGGLSTNRG